MAGADIAFVTLGCAKNEVDTDKMSSRLVSAGYTVTDEPLDARLVIVNTCSFLVSAAEESLDTIFDIVEAQQEAGTGAKLLVAGCMPSRYGSELEEELEEAAGFLEAGDEEHVTDVVEQIIGSPSTAVPAHIEAYGFSRYEVGASAYVKISDGCDRFCSYCMIPYIRGRYHSYELDDVLAEVRELVQRGVAEIVFIGQDTGIWGMDLAGSQNLALLLERASSEFPDMWFRVLYLQPAGINDELLELMDSRENICSYFDIPLQHANADVLKAMNRKGSTREYLDLVERIRAKVHGVQLRTTLMAGFPGETQEQFEELLDFVDEAEFDYAVVFPYSRETGSKAAEFDNQVDDDDKIERAQQLLDACEAIGHKRNERHIGSVLDVLVEGFEETDIGPEAVGRWMGQAPEVDGQVHIALEEGDEIEVGSIVRVEITDSFCYDLEGVLA